MLTAGSPSKGYRCLPFDFPVLGGCLLRPLQLTQLLTLRFDQPAAAWVLPSLTSSACSNTSSLAGSMCPKAYRNEEQQSLFPPGIKQTVSLLKMRSSTIFSHTLSAQYQAFTSILADSTTFTLYPPLYPPLFSLSLSRAQAPHSKCPPPTLVGDRALQLLPPRSPKQRLPPNHGGETTSWPPLAVLTPQRRNSPGTFLRLTLATVSLSLTHSQAPSSCCR